MGKKAKKLLFFVAAVFGLCLSMLSFNTVKASAACKHSYKWVTVIKSTCTGSGREEYRCRYCNLLNGAKSTPPNGHYPNRAVATCTQAKKCNTCGAVLQSAYGHSKRYQSATCTENNTCTSCGIILEYAKGHSANHAATCIDASTCTRCGKQLEAAKGHTPNRSTATCTADKKCSACNAVLQQAYGHTPRYQSATCTENNTCTSCGEVVEYAKGHSANHLATCTDASTCTRCGKQLEAAKGHTPNRSTATCTADQKCINCNVVLQKAYGHSPRYQSATCTENNTCTSCGLILENARGHVADRKADCTHASKCTRCGKTLEGVRGHRTNVPVATCTQDKICTACGQLLQRAYGHRPKNPSATCREANTCTSCGIVLEEKRPHSLTRYHIEPTCYHSGEDGMKCINCGIRINAFAIQPLPHTWVQDVKRSTSTTIYYYCKNAGCGATKTAKRYSGTTVPTTTEKYSVALISGDNNCNKFNLLVVPTMNFERCCENYSGNFEKSSAFPDGIANMDYTDKASKLDFIKYMTSSKTFIYDGHGLASGEVTWMCPSDYVEIMPGSFKDVDLSNLDVACLMSCFSAGNCTNYNAKSESYSIDQTKVDEYEEDHYQDSVAYAVSKAGAGITIGCNVTILSSLSYDWAYKFTEHYVKIVENAEKISNEEDRRQYVQDMSLELAMSVTNEVCPKYPETEFTPYRNTIVAFENDSEGNVIVHRVDDPDSTYRALCSDGCYVVGIDEYFDEMLECYQ